MAAIWDPEMFPISTVSLRLKCMQHPREQTFLPRISFHKRGINLQTISESGRILASTAMGMHHTRLDAFGRTGMTAVF